jgi:uncharacterized membrane protein YfcA
VLVGVALGLLGGGGSILAVPILIYVAGLPAREGIGAALLMVGATSAVGAVLQWRAGNVHGGAAAAFGLAGMAGAPLGALLTPVVPEPVLMLLFGLLMAVVGTLMVRGRRDGGSEAPPRPSWMLPVAGLLVGVLTGFLGIGGGFLVVPALVLLARLPMATAVGTSLVVIALNAGAGFAAHLGRGGVPLRLTVLLTLGSLAGMLAGTRTGARWPAERLRLAFGGAVLALGGMVAARNLAVLVR